MHRTMRRLVVPVVGLALIGAACTSDDDDSGDSGDTEPAETEAAADTEAPAETDAETEEPAETEAPAETDEVEVTQSDGETLAAVQSAGVVKCGTRDALTGFAVLTPEGDHEGFDSDFCRAIAAAVLGDANAVEHVDLETADRFTALQSGEVDVLVRNTTWTATRDGAEGATFLHTTYYDGQGMMVASDAGFSSLEDMDGVIVCVAQGTTTEGNAANEAARLGVDWEVRAFESNELIQEAFLAGQCDGWSADGSALVGERSVYPDGPESLTILPEVMSKEPLGPLVRDGDDQWAQAVEWTIFATLLAEELGIDSSNVDSFGDTDDESIRKLLGLEVEGDEGAAVLDPGLGLPADFAYQVISQVGNYAEIFDRNLTPLGLERGLNALYTDGGIQYAPPYK